MYFTIDGEPQGKGRPRFSSVNNRAYTPDKTKTYENQVQWEFQKQRRNNEMFEKGIALKMSITAVYAIPKSASKKKRKQMLDGEILPTKKPDADNIIKIIADSLNGLAYHDDAQIVNITCEKKYGENPYVFVVLERI